METTFENISPATKERYAKFITNTQRLAERHRLYLQDEGRTFADCYELKLTDQKATIYIDPAVPMDLHDELHEVFKHAFS